MAGIAVKLSYYLRLLVAGVIHLPISHGMIPSMEWHSVLLKKAVQIKA